MATYERRGWAVCECGRRNASNPPCSHHNLPLHLPATGPSGTVYLAYHPFTLVTESVEYAKPVLVQVFKLLL